PRARTRSSKSPILRRRTFGSFRLLAGGSAHVREQYGLRHQSCAIEATGTDSSIHFPPSIWRAYEDVAQSAARAGPASEPCRADSRWAGQGSVDHDVQESDARAAAPP